MKKHILIHTLIFPPDQVSTAYLYGDISKVLIADGWEVTVITTYPHYNVSEGFLENSRKTLWYRTTNFEGATVFHVPQVKNKQLWKRAAYILYFHCFFLIKAIFMPRFDVVLSPSPPLTVGWLSGIVAFLRGAKAVYNVQEIYPDILIKSGNIKSGLIISILKWLEKATYKLNHSVVTIDESFERTIAPRMAAGKLTVIPNFVDTTLYYPYDKQFDDDFKFEGKFVVGYAGNVGKAQDWEAVLHAAKSLEAYDDILFVIMGGGAEWESIHEYAKGVKNIHVLPYQPRERLPMFTSRVDVHFISMSESADMDGFPSKVYTILACKRPILAMTSQTSPLGNLLRKVDFGMVLPRGDSSAFAEGIRSIKADMPDETKAREVRQFIENEYSKEAVTRRYLNLINGLTGKS